MVEISHARFRAHEETKKIGIALESLVFENGVLFVFVENTENIF